jgi:hypothetical protein
MVDDKNQANMLSSSFYTTEEQIHELFAKYVLQPHDSKQQ